jgi:hypothetical protein|tara:strand:+ start:348 stop:500 length:153 start_codon:yes stop_codon:yes gene_type:complete
MNEHQRKGIALAIGGLLFIPFGKLIWVMPIATFVSVTAIAIGLSMWIKGK